MAKLRLGPRFSTAPVPYRVGPDQTVCHALVMKTKTLLDVRAIRSRLDDARQYSPSVVAALKAGMTRTLAASKSFRTDTSYIRPRARSCICLNPNG